MITLSLFVIIMTIIGVYMYITKQKSRGINKQPVDNYSDFADLYIGKSFNFDNTIKYLINSDLIEIPTNVQWVKDINRFSIDDNKLELFTLDDNYYLMYDGAEYKLYLLYNCYTSDEDVIDDAEVTLHGVNKEWTYIDDSGLLEVEWKDKHDHFIENKLLRMYKLEKDNNTEWLLLLTGERTMLTDCLVGIQIHQSQLLPPQ